jgi:hypothetical protein
LNSAVVGYIKSVPFYWKTSDVSNRTRHIS